MILILTFILSTSSMAISSISDNLEIKAYLDPALETILQNTRSDKRIPVDVWLYETETMEEREAAVLSKTGINKRKIISTENAPLSEKTTLSASKIDEYIEAERALYAKNRKDQYALLLKNYESMEGLKETREVKRLFFSQYAPMISAELTPAEIKTLARDTRVQSIYYSPHVTLENNSDIAAQVTAAGYVRDNMGYTGSGIKIGMIESSMPDPQSNYFSSNVICDSTAEPLPGGTWHANRVAVIMVGAAAENNGVVYKGIVPNATLYSTCYNNTNTAVDWRSKVEWLLTQGVHVINMSAEIKLLDENWIPGEEHVVDPSLYPEAGLYDLHERWLDHVAISHSVHFVVSAGNHDPQIGHKITSPALAYNIISVGAIDDNNTASNHQDDTRALFSCYEETIGTNKPDLVAPGANIYTAVPIDYASDLTPEQQTSGTSFAAPQVTAIVAQLCQYRPALRTLQDAMKAILTASISHGKLAFDSSDADAVNFDKYGAGVVNAQAAFYTAGNGRYLTADFPANTAANTERRYTFYVSSSDTKIRVSLAWLKYSTVSGTHATSDPADYAIADLDLYILDPNGNYIASAITSDNNVEIIDFEPNSAGNYTIVVSHCEGSPRATYYALAWW